MGKILLLFTKTFIHSNLELKKVSALNTLGKISIKTNNKQTKGNNLQQASTSHCPYLPSEVALPQAPNLHWNKITQEFAPTPVMLCLGSGDTALPTPGLTARDCRAPDQAASPAAAQTQRDVELGLLGQSGNLPSAFTWQAQYLLLAISLYHHIHVQPHFQFSNGYNTLQYWEYGGRQWGRDQGMHEKFKNRPKKFLFRSPLCK